MGSVVVIGERVRGWALAGVTVVEAGDPDAVRAAWDGLGTDVAAVLLTTGAAAALSAQLADRFWPLVAVIPDD
jgi:vacuolar-type H+-ATPase subunit F/Vma7